MLGRPAQRLMLAALLRAGPPQGHLVRRPQFVVRQRRALAAYDARYASTA
jgi:hypothetical protein